MTDIRSLVRSVNPVTAGQTLLADGELDALLVLINERNGETNIEELAMRVQPVKPRRRGWLVAGATAAIALAVLAPVLLVAGGSEPDVGGTGPAAATSVPATTVLQATTSAEVADGWNRVPRNDTVFGGDGTQIMWSVTGGGPGLVAAGWDGPDAAIWLSLDGTAWLRVPHDDTLFGGASISDVTVGGPGLVAVGIVEPVPVEDHGAQGFLGGDAAVWTSVDGISWSRVPHDEGVFGASHMEAVTVGGPGLVAVGTTFLNPATEEIQAAAVWTSVDGITWSRVPHDEAVFGDGAMRDVTVGGPGLVAVGDTLSENGTDAVVWTSDDGITWSRVPHDEAVFGDDRTMHSVIAGGPVLVAVGETHEPSLAAVWTSDDGITWSPVPHDEAVFGRANMYAVTVAGSGLVAVGVNESSGFDGGVWRWEG